MGNVRYALFLALFLASCSSPVPFEELAISPEGVNDVFGSIMDEDHILLIRQESGIEHIRGFHTTLIEHTISSGEEKVLFESGIMKGKEDDSKMLVIDSPPQASDDGTIEFSVVESSEIEYLPQNAMYTATINLQTKETSIVPSSHRKETRLDDRGNPIAEDFSRRSVKIGGTTLEIASNFSANTKNIVQNGSIIASMEATHDFFFNNDSILYENNRHVTHHVMRTGEKKEIFDPIAMDGVKAIYGITNDNGILIESKQGNYFLYSMSEGAWQLIAQNDEVSDIVPPKFNSMGTILTDNRILLKKVGKNSGDGKLFLYTATRKGKAIQSQTIPQLDMGKSMGKQEQVIGVRKGNIAPPFDLNTSDNTPLKSPSQGTMGKWIVIYTWATWCPQCTREFPSIAGAFNDVKPTHLEFIAVDIDLSENNDMISHYMDEKGYALQSAMATSTFLKDYKIRSTTTKIIIDPQGVVQYSGSGVLSKEHWKTIFTAGK